MADLSITAANVIPESDGLRVENGYSYATITAGKVVKKNAAGLWVLADVDDAPYETDVLGIALNAASSGQPVQVQVGGKLTIGASVLAGVVYYLSEDGGICPVADLANPEYTTPVMLAYSTTKVKLILTPMPGAQLA